MQALPAWRPFWMAWSAVSDNMVGHLRAKINIENGQDMLKSCDILLEEIII